MAVGRESSWFVRYMELSLGRRRSTARALASGAFLVSAVAGGYMLFAYPVLRLPGGPTADGYQREVSSWLWQLGAALVLLGLAGHLAILATGPRRDDGGDSTDGCAVRSAGVVMVILAGIGTGVAIALAGTDGERRAVALLPLLVGPIVGASALRRSTRDQRRR